MFKKKKKESEEIPAAAAVPVVSEPVVDPIGKHVLTVSSDFVGTCSCGNWECHPQGERPNEIETTPKIKEAHDRHLRIADDQDKAVEAKAARLKAKENASV